MTKKAALLLLPNLLGDLPHHEIFLPPSVDKAVVSLDGLIAESVKGGRRYLSRFKMEKAPHLVPLALLNEHTKDDEIDFLLEPMRKGERWGLVSDAGIPCLADPGAVLVRRASQLGIKVQAFVGPSSITMALMLSGLQGQRFTFHGYLPRETEALKAQLRGIEAASKRENSTHIWIETPYRNGKMIEAALEALAPETLFCVAGSLTLPEQKVMTWEIGVWKKYQSLPKFDEDPAVFLLQA
jgi:16S rRNA (cytidine1402-2'-O)-methyltransferase